MRSNIRIGKNVDRQLLENALAQSQSLSQFAMNSDSFGGGRAGAFGAVAQGITAAIGAYGQYKNQQKLAELNASDAQAFANFATAQGNPELAKIASRLSPETRESYYLSMALPQFQNQNIPSSIREYEYFSKLAPEQQAQYLGVKRNIAGEGAVINQQGQAQTLTGYGQAGAQRAGMEQTAKNVSDYRFAEPTAQAKAKGTETGKKLGEITQKEIQAPINIELANEAEKLLPTSTSGLIQNIGTKGTELVGLSTKASQTDAQLKALSAQLVLNVPRMEGQQSREDLKLYQQAAGDISNPNLPYKTRLASLQTIKTLNKKYLPKNQPQQNIEKSVLLPPAKTPAQSNIKFLGFE